MRYSLENNYWIKDNETNKHLSLTDAVKVLNEQDAQLTEIDNIITHFRYFLKNLPRGCASDINGAHILIKKMYEYMVKIKKVVDNE